ncbi:MAG: GAF domain-containing SpoIIE family protein phosphatase [Bacteroidota bacterium]
MGTAPKLPNEHQRLLKSNILDTEAEKELNDLTELAAQICETPMALLSLVDEDKQWFKSNWGLSAKQTPHLVSFCTYAITESRKDVFEVEDTLEDKRFSQNPLVVDAPKIRFYAGIPLETEAGYRIGTICVLDQKPRKLTQKQRFALRVLADQVMSHLNTRLKFEELKESALQLNQYNQELIEVQGQLESSLRYARRIQEAMLPSISAIKEVLSEYFILSLPKSEVSGDLCWYAQEDDKVVMVVADCTGHGVSGALMSVIGNEMLRQKIHREKNFNPAEILTHLNQSIASLWKKQKKRRLDGMETSIVTLDLKKKTLQFSGAKRPLIYFDREGKRHLIRGNRLGIYGHKKNFAFTLHEIPFDEVDTFYLYTDGFEDQLSDKSHKRVSKKVLLDLLSEIQILAMAEQKRYLYQFHNFWKGHGAQIDDVTFLGIKVSSIFDGE